MHCWIADSSWMNLPVHVFTHSLFSGKAPQALLTFKKVGDLQARNQEGATGQSVTVIFKNTFS